MVRVAALGVRRRRAALAVLLRGQVLAARRGWRRERLRVVVEVAGVALGGGGAAARLQRHPTTWRVVTVAHVSAAGCGGRGKVAVGVWPIAVKGAEEGRETERKKLLIWHRMAWNESNARLG